MKTHSSLHVQSARELGHTLLLPDRQLQLIRLVVQEVPLQRLRLVQVDAPHMGMGQVRVQHQVFGRRPLPWRSKENEYA